MQSWKPSPPGQKIVLVSSGQLKSMKHFVPSVNSIEVGADIALILANDVYLFGKTHLYLLGGGRRGDGEYVGAPVGKVR